MIVLVEAVGAGFGDVRSAATWIGLTVLLWVTSLPFAVLGVFIGFMVTPEAAFPVVTGLMFVLGYFGGLFNPVDEMPGSLQFIAHLMPNYHQVALALAFLDGQTLALSHWLILAGYVRSLDWPSGGSTGSKKPEASPDRKRPARGSRGASVTLGSPGTGRHPHDQPRPALRGRVRDLVGLLVKPPDGALILCVDETQSLADGGSHADDRLVERLAAHRAEEGSYSRS